MYTYMDKFYNIITVVKIIPSRKAGHSAMIGSCSRILLGISDDPLLAGIKQHTVCLASFTLLLWSTLGEFALLLQLECYANRPIYIDMAIVY